MTDSADAAPAAGGLFVSYAQNGEDVLLWRALGAVANGFYVDVGAYDPVDCSVTKAFSDRGWRGINIEPVAELLAAFAEARPRDVNLAVAVGAAEGEITLHVIAGTGLSTFDTAVVHKHVASGFGVTPRRVPLRRLEAILDAHAPGPIHFLKIDVEGAERAVLEGGDFRRHRPWIVVIEATEPLEGRPTHDAWEPLLLGQGYIFAFFDGLNRFYVAAEQAHLLDAFGAPANVFDRFVRHDWLAAETKAAAAAQQLAATIEERDALAAKLGPPAANWRRLVERLEMPEGPASLRVLLPAARALRAIGRLWRR